MLQYPQVCNMDANDTGKQALAAAIEESAGVIRNLAVQLDAIERLAGVIVTALKDGHKVLTAGNGGSAAEAFHMAEELVGRFRDDRPSLPAVCLAADGTALTCIANDYGFDSVFSRQVEGLGQPGDVLVLFTTSGRAANLDHALRAARAKGLKTACVLGRDGGALAGRSDVEIVVGYEATERIQEAHQVLVHLVLDVVERAYT